MTRQEAIEVLKNTIAYESGFAEAKQMAIEALEKKPSEDCISREFALKVIDNYGYNYPTKGEWVEVVKRTEQYDREGRKSWAVIYQCPNCGFVLNAIENHTAQYNYCPNCGAKMRLE